MRAGLILTGHLRSFEVCAPTLIERVISPIQEDGHEVKIFVDTWDTLGGVPHNDGVTVDLKTEEKLESINTLYNNPILNIEEHFHIDGSKYEGNHATHFGPHFALSMFYKIQQGYLLYKEYSEKTGWTANALIRCRPDLYFLTKLHTDVLAPSNCIWTPDFASWGGMNDQFAVGPPDLMYHYFKTYERIDKMFDSGAALHPESLLNKNITDNKISIGKTHILYDLVRVSGARITQR